MNAKSILSVFVLMMGIFISALLVGNVLAQNVSTGKKLFNIEYPIPELGSCKDESACREYCDKPENLKACISFAEKKSLMPKEEIEAAKKFAMVGKGPGGCKTKESCESFCEDISRIDECISFAEKNDFVPKEKLEEAKKVKAAIDKGVKPPPCKNKKECDAYCEDSGHMEECIAFGEAAGFLKGKELEDSRKVLVAIKKGIKPPACRGKEKCDAYCSNPNNMEECMTFAEAAGFMKENEKEDAKKILAALKKGVKPPACRGKEECDVYCSDESRFEECVIFAEAAGFMSSEEAKMSRKTKGKGPGGCRGKEECEAFCNNSDNQEMCFLFGKEHGFIPEEELNKMEGNKQKFTQSFTDAPPEVMECLQSSLGTEMVDKFKSGSSMPSRDIGEKMKICFEKSMRPPKFGMEKCVGENCPPPPPGADGKIMMPPQAGPGGCSNPEECEKYCESHKEECKNFKPQMPQPSTRMWGTGEMRGGMPCEGEGCKNIELPRQMMEIKEFIEGVDPFSREGKIKEVFEGKEIFNGDELIKRFSPERQGESIKPMIPSQPRFSPENMKQQIPNLSDPSKFQMQPKDFSRPGEFPFGDFKQYNQQFIPQQPFVGGQPPQGFQPPPATPPQQFAPSPSAPPPTPPSPSGAITPQSLLGLIFNIFVGFSR